MDFVSQDQMVHFQRRLSETRVWCIIQDWSANPAEKLRTALFRPSEHATHPQTFPDSDELWEKTPQQRQQLVECLALQRAALLQEQHISLLSPKEALNSGRILAFTPDGTLSDGAADLATYGFFDGDNIPAWDTWIWYVTNDFVSKPEFWSGAVTDSYLLSWVPEPLIEVVTSGIDVNPEECICWATDLDTPFIRQLKQAGFVC